MDDIVQLKPKKVDEPPHQVVVANGDYDPRTKELMDIEFQRRLQQGGIFAARINYD